MNMTMLLGTGVLALARVPLGDSPAQPRVHTRPQGSAKGTDAWRTPEDNDFIRLPGLFRRWEFQQVVDTDADFHIEAAGCAEDGTELFSVYRRENAAAKEA
ncbi:hypothetical protein MYMAC_001943 [Corallococcus macrosporus DSM 14697]|uniref:Uncharacterized protein n=2 Tax=Corallococcus macrosporus TaxID=35 RepID=A0A250JSK4_9BACT|nr:hypothetical protein MYMAC_001943 [Corallococcus macrosporus DSM 14697]